MSTSIVSLLSGGSGFYQGAIGLIAMLKKYAPQYEHTLLIESHKYTEVAKEYLVSIGWNLLSVKPHRSQDTQFTAQRWPNTFTKINLWNLDFTKVIYLDLDAIPFSDITSLDNVTNDDKLYASVFPGKWYKFRSGLMVLKPDKQIYCDLVKLLTLDTDINRAKHGDQGLLNVYFEDNFTPLETKYHVVERPIPADTIIRHLIPKPWEESLREAHYQEWQSEYNKLKPPNMKICTDAKYE